MAKRSPFLQRRGDAFGFRIAVPADLRSIIGHREITRSLRASNKFEAVPLALALAARAKKIFANVRDAMSDEDAKRLKEWIEQARKMGYLRERIEELEDEMVAMRLRHLKELQDVREKATLQARADALIEAVKHGGTSIPPVQPSPILTPSPTTPHADPSPKLAKTVKDFLDGYRRDKKGPMLTKHRGGLFHSPVPCDSVHTPGRRKSGPACNAFAADIIGRAA